MAVYHSSVSPLHITSGSSAGDTLRTFVDGQVVLTHDVLHEGPAPHVDGDAWHATRARFLADAYDPNVDEIRADLARVDRTIADHARSALAFAEGFGASTEARSASEGG